MKVKDLMAKLEEMNPNAEIMAIVPDTWREDDGYCIVADVEEEFSHLVTLGLTFQVKF